MGSVQTVFVTALLICVHANTRHHQSWPPLDRRKHFARTEPAFFHREPRPLHRETGLHVRRATHRTGHCRDEPDAASGGRRAEPQTVQQAACPIGTVHDPFVARGLDVLNHACSARDARFVLVGAPSGVIPVPEGGAHQSVGSSLAGVSRDGLASFEPLLPPHCKTITVVDGCPATLSWPGSVQGHQMIPTGAEHSGQTGTIADLYRHHGIDAAAIVEKVNGLTDGKALSARGRGASGNPCRVQYGMRARLMN